MTTDILKIKDMWEKIKRLPYERKEVRYDILVESVKKSGWLKEKFTSTKNQQELNRKQ
ncbi:hypothetical protein ES705_48566 [subsurface metagenome]